MYEGNAFELCFTVKCFVFSVCIAICRFCDVFLPILQTRDAVVDCISVMFLY